MQDPFIVCSLCSSCHRTKTQDQEQIPTHTVVFPNGLRTVDAPVQTRRVVLGNANDGLYDEDEVGDYSKDSMW